jgi:hypothetical protein
VIDLTVPCFQFQSDFVYTVNDDLSVQFIDDTPGEPNQWLWGFGDASTSNVQNPLHHYDSAGIYNVCLLVQNTEDGCNSSFCQAVNIGVTGVNSVPNYNRTLSIFPNPANIKQRSWQIEGLLEEDLHQPLSLKLYDFQGRTMLQQEVIGQKNMSLHIEQPLARGIYVVEMLSTEGWIYRARILIL